MKFSPTPVPKSLLDMDVANYCEGLDPTYSTLGFENAEVLYCGGECCAFCPKYVFLSTLNVADGVDVAACTNTQMIILLEVCVCYSVVTKMLTELVILTDVLHVLYFYLFVLLCKVS